MFLSKLSCLINFDSLYVFFGRKFIKNLFCFPKYLDVNVYFAPDLLLVVLLMVSGGAGLGRVGLK